MALSHWLMVSHWLGSDCSTLMSGTLILAIPLHTDNLCYGPTMQRPSSNDHHLLGHIAIRCPMVSNQGITPGPQPPLWATRAAALSASCCRLPLGTTSQVTATLTGPEAVPTQLQMAIRGLPTWASTNAWRLRYMVYLGENTVVLASPPVSLLLTLELFHKEHAASLLRTLHFWGVHLLLFA